jgi:hypothetical protein
MRIVKKKSQPVSIYYLYLITHNNFNNTKTFSMKKLLLFSIISLSLFACSDKDKKEDDSSKKNDEMKATYEKNLASLKNGIAAFEKGDVDGWAANVADSAVWNSPSYGDTVHSKAHWKESLKYYIDNWTNLKLNNATFLPGVDSATQQLDGSVRYYGSWDAVHKSGVVTKVSFYGTYDFNKDNKIINGSDFFDVGGLMNAVKPKGK